MGRAGFNSTAAEPMYLNFKLTHEEPGSAAGEKSHVLVACSST